MTPELGPTARALLDAARSGGPDTAAIARMRGKIGAATVPAATSATVTGSLASKLGLVALALVVATGAVLFATSDRDEVVPLASHEISQPPPLVQAVRDSALPNVVPSIDPTAIEIEPSAPPRRVALASKPEPIGLAREVLLVDRAMTALRHGNANGALLAVRAYATEAGQRGQLAEDAAAIEIEALCTLRDATAVAKLARFDGRWPTSVQGPRLARACSGL